MTVTAAPEQDNKTVGRGLEDDPRWQLIQRMVASAGFARSPRLVSFLLYVTERSLSGAAHEINEQSIGVRVFGRTDGYDSNDDNIVRSHASRLRQKLEAYYQGPGCGEVLRVSIPKGSYVPSFYDSPVEDAFHRGDTSPAILKTTDAAVGGEPLDILPHPFLASPARFAPSEGVQSRQAVVPFRYWLWTVAACVASVLLTVALMSYMRGRRSTDSANANHALWEELLNGRRNTLIVNGDSSLVLYENMTGKMLSIGDYLSGNYRDELVSQDKTDPHMLRTIARRRLTSIVDLDIANRITSRPELAPGHAVLRYARDLHVDDLKGSNVILIGSQEANPWVQLYGESLNFTLVPNQQTKVFTIKNRAAKAGEASEYQSIPGDPERRAYAAVAFLRNVDRSGRTLIIQGTGMAGTEAAADYVLNQDVLSSLLHGATSANGNLPDFEMLLETSNLNGNAPQSKLVALRVNGK